MIPVGITGLAAIKAVEPVYPVPVRIAQLDRVAPALHLTGVTGPVTTAAGKGPGRQHQENEKKLPHGVAPFGHDLWSDSIGTG